jgi:rare lipoprotein A
MSDQGFREIQLGGKQLVFLFMALVVGAVAIFLLGISVGRGVRDTADNASGTDVAIAVPPAPAEMPPRTETTPADLRYHDQLQGQAPPASPASATGKTAETPAPAAEPPPTVAEPAGASVAAPTRAAQPPKPEPSPPASVTKDKVPAAPAAAPPGAGWFVQAGAFRSRENADRRASQLKGKGYSQATVTSGGASTLFRVRIGPFADHAEADQVAVRLQREEGGQKPLVQR